MSQFLQVCCRITPLVCTHVSRVAQLEDHGGERNFLPDYVGVHRVALNDIEMVAGERAPRQAKLYGGSYGVREKEITEQRGSEKTMELAQSRNGRVARSLPQNEATTKAGSGRTHRLSRTPPCPRALRRPRTPRRSSSASPYPASYSARRTPSIRCTPATFPCISWWRRRSSRPHQRELSRG